MVTLEQLLIDKSLIELSKMMVKAFNGLKSEVVGDDDLDLEIGSFVLLMHFQIMDITPTYSMLLERPWIHLASVALSSFH